MAKDSRVEASSRRSENPAAFILNWSCFKWITFMTSADSYRCDSYCLARVFQNLPAPPKHYGVLDVFADFQSFFELENLGSHLAMSTDDRFIPQSKEIFPKICQVRPMPNCAWSSVSPLLICSTCHRLYPSSTFLLNFLGSCVVKTSHMISFVHLLAGSNIAKKHLRGDKYLSVSLFFFYLVSYITSCTWKD